jgi:hypothetical protein
MRKIKYRKKELKILSVSRTDYGFQKDFFDEFEGMSGSYHYEFAVLYDIFVFNCSIWVDESGKIHNFEIPLEYAEHDFGGPVLCNDINS